MPAPLTTLTDTQNDPGSASLAEAPEAQRQRRAVIARAGRVWRRAGVRAVDRRRLASELAAELAAASADGHPATAVLGGDPDTTVRHWALERVLSGRALRLGVLVPLALGSVVVASAVFFTDLVVTFTVPGPPTSHPAVLVSMWVSTAVMCVLLPTLACWAVLRTGHDPRAAATARWLLVALPIGGLAALALGALTVVATETLLDGLPRVALVVLVVLLTTAAAVTAARHLATTYHRDSPTH